MTVNPVRVPQCPCSVSLLPLCLHTTCSLPSCLCNPLVEITEAAVRKPTIMIDSPFRLTYWETDGKSCNDPASTGSSATLLSSSPRWGWSAAGVCHHPPRVWPAWRGHTHQAWRWSGYTHTHINAYTHKHTQRRKRGTQAPHINSPRQTHKKKTVHKHSWTLGHQIQVHDTFLWVTLLQVLISLYFHLKSKWRHPSVFFRSEIKEWKSVKMFSGKFTDYRIRLDKWDVWQQCTTKKRGN